MSGSVIEEDLAIEGNLVAEDGNVSIKGSVGGDVTAKLVDIQQSGTVTGTIRAAEVKIAGKLKGSVQCGGLTLAVGSITEADVKTDTLSVEAGARIAGRIKSEGDEPTSPNTNP